MQNPRYIWVLGLVGTALLIMGPILLLMPNDALTNHDPWANVPVRAPQTNHASLMSTPFETGQEVTQACLVCHQDAAHDFMQTSHWTWLSEPTYDPARDEMVQTGKANLLNNFCIGIRSNEASCAACHAGYGWDSPNFDFTDHSNVDCLVCHEQSGTYVKTRAGLPSEDSDLLAAAQSVGLPTRENCGTCHFNGGGGNAVKHGDMDQSLYYPSPMQDVHMGRHDFQCIDCHTTENHQISGRAISLGVDMRDNQISCTDCHQPEAVHSDARINTHLSALACQTCHIPSGSTREATKMLWDWSTAGDPLMEEDPNTYMRMKGSFVYEMDFIPTYAWYNGTVNRYQDGDPTNYPDVTALNAPNGDINDPDALIWPFKVHMATQPYDLIFDHLLQPSTAGQGGYWTTFEWVSALELGAQVSGIAYSGQHDFAETSMYWNLSHMVVPAQNALQCADCHGETTRFDWEALGYPGDPLTWGGR